MKVIITDIFLRKTFDVINIFLTNYSDIDLLLCNSHDTKMLRFFSRLIYHKDFFLIRKDSYENFSLDLARVISFYGREDLVFLPVEEDSTLLFLRFIEDHSANNLKFKLPTLINFERVRDKESLWLFCAHNNIPVPKIFQSTDAILNSGTFCPLIIKPKVGSGAKGIFYIDNIQQLEKFDKVDINKYIIQELIPNSHSVIGGFFLADKGRIHSYYCHERIRTYPERGGVTVYSKTVFNQNIIDIAGKLLEKLNWSGLIMIEFLYDRNEDCYKVIEINPRLWGSILLSEFSGSKMLIKYVNLCIGMPLGKNCYLENKYIRWLFPFDILAYIRSGFQITSFWNFSNTCFINFTYSTFFRSFIFILHTILDFRMVKKLIGRMVKI